MIRRKFWTFAFLGLIASISVFSPAHANDAQRLLNQLLGGTDIFRTQPPPDQRPIGRVQRDRRNKAPRQDLYDIQKRLLELGYDVGEPDGRPGSRTQRAIRLYQSDNGFPATGELSPSQHQLLMRGKTQPGGEPIRMSGDEPELTRAEMADMQRGLTALGFDIGAADGVAGARTGRAIAKFLTDRGYDPYQTPVHQARQLVLDASGVAATMAGQDAEMGEIDAPVAQGSKEFVETFYEWGGNSTANDNDEAALNEALGRRFIAADRAILDNSPDVARWLESMGSGYRGTWSPQEAKGLYKKYRDGSEFDKRDATTSFAAYLNSQAKNGPIRLVRVHPVDLGTYDFQTGTFPLRQNGNSHFGRVLTLYGPGSSLATVEIENWDLPAKLPVAKLQAESLANELNRAGSRTVYISATYQIGEFALEENSDGSKSIVAKGVAERVSLHKRDSNARMGLGAIIYEVPLAEPKKGEPVTPEIVGPAADNLQSWTRLGVPQKDNRVLLAGRRGPEADKKIDSAFKLLALANSPERPRSLGPAFQFAKEYSSRQDFKSIFPVERNETLFLRELSGDIFRQKELVDRFNAELLPKIIAKAPQLPVRMRVGVPLRARTYDIEAETYIVEREYPHLLGSFDSNLEPQLPGRLKVPAKTVRRLNEEARSSKGERELYLAFDIDVEAIKVQYQEYNVGPFGSSDFRSAFSGKATGVALYQDAELSHFVMSLPLEDFVTKREVLVGDKKPEGTYLSRWNVAAMAAKLLDDADFGRGLVESSEFVRKQNEFGRDDAIAQGVVRLSNSEPSKDAAMFLHGSIKLGTYETDAFKVTDQRFAVVLENDIEQLDQGQVALAAENSDVLARIPMQKDAAQKLVTNNPLREFPAIFRVRPVRAEKINEQTAVARLDVFIDEVYLMDTNKTDRVIFSIKSGATDFGEKLTLEKVPERLPVNRETTTLFLAKHGGVTLDDDALRSLLAIRWEEESKQRYDTINSDPAPWGRFFPLNYRALTESDYDRLLPSFQKWTQERLDKLPNKLIFEVEGDPGAGYGFGAPPSVYSEILEKVGISLSDYQSFRGWLFNPPIQDDAGSWKRQKSILGLRQNGDNNSHVDVYVPLPEMPSTPPESVVNAVSVDMDLRSAFFTADSGDGKPAVVLDVVPTEVRWFGRKSPSNKREMLGKFPVAPVAPREEVIATDLDILGITIGMAQVDAEEKLRNAITLDRILELKGDASDRTVIAEAARMYVSKDGTDLIGVLYGPINEEPIVYGVSRMHFTETGAVTKGQVLGALEKKYGAVSNANDWSWGDTVGFANCSNKGFGSINWSGAPVVEGRPFIVGKLSAQRILADPALMAEVLLIRRLEFVDWGFEVQGQVDQCKPTLKAEFLENYRVGRAGEQIPGADSTLLKTLLFDKATRQTNLLKAQNAPKPEPAAVDIKL